ncbi:hypothetical protein ACN38_g1375 [Penicillium nordicum]|uniref:ATP synthase subunit 4 n=1 Tax=Penicillium nordicum TaxID=229535 RepID=A0A0M8PGF7_9EURO|nr:hypothetical protein ACN38_g1375 [Penicillium nordicum]
MLSPQFRSPTPLTKILPSATMASRLAKSAIGASRLRPALPARGVPAVTANLTSSRQASNVPAEEPSKKAQSILNAIPGNSLVTKTATLSAAAGLSIAAISNELYVMNEETVAAFCLLSVFTAVGKYGGPAYREWAEGQVQKHKDILNAARADHTNAVQQPLRCFQGNRPARVPGLRAPAAHCPRCRGQAGPRLVGALREPGQAAPAA